MVSRDLVPMRERMRRATRAGQAAADCGGLRAGHNGGDAASPLSGVKRKSDFGAVRAAAFDPKAGIEPLIVYRNAACRGHPVGTSRIPEGRDPLHALPQNKLHPD